ncbi:Fur-regulated basic protein FbpA [Heyndrickxia sp. NPDC080065]
MGVFKAPTDRHLYELSIKVLEK